MPYSPVCVLFGVHGVIGRSIHKKLSERLPDYKIFGFDRSRIDASSSEQVSSVIDYVNPDLVINCVGMSDPERCENDPRAAFKSNATVPEVISSCCSRRKCKLIHFSSYAVFPGRDTAYTEKSRPRPMGTLGRSKWDGEIAIQKLLKNHLIIRPGFLLSPDKRNCLADWISRAQHNGTVMVREMKVSPIDSVDLAEAVMSLIDADATGTFHVANRGAAEVREIAESAISMAGLRAKVAQTPDILNSWFKSLLPRIVLLSPSKYIKSTGSDMKPWNDSLRHCLFSMNKPKE